MTLGRNVELQSHITEIDYFAEFAVKKMKIFKYIEKLRILLMFIQIENKTMIEFVNTKL